MKLFVGLGNPGDKYSGNRHNIGFMAVDAIARAHGFSPWRKKFNALTCDGTLSGARVTLLKPETFMNDSGRAVGEAMRFLKIDPADVYVFHDELDLAPNKIKVKSGGGNAGHNGLKSISAHIGNDYPRVRIGIGHHGSKDVVVHSVLNDYATSERAWVQAMLDAIAEASGHLAKGDDARFLTDVARKTQLPDDGQSAPEKPQPKAKPAEPKPASAKSGHPAGERANKRQSALADNLKKWLSARKSED